MEIKDITTNRDALIFKVLCNALGHDVETVAVAFTNMASNVRDAIIEQALTAETEEQLEAVQNVFDNYLGNES